jgi:signal transduction histidine kinase/DNA-binding response OmpR family regulator
VATGLLAGLAAHYAALERESEFNRRATIVATAVRIAVEDRLQELAALRGLFAASTSVEAGEFADFVRTGVPPGRGIRALEWVPRVRDDERAAFERLIAERVAAGFAIHGISAPSAGDRFPVTYIEPFIPNRMAFGADLASEPRRAAAIAAARDSGEAAVTAPVHLVQDVGEEPAVLLVRPVYANGQPTGSVEERRRGLAGLVVAVLDLRDLVDAATAPLPDHGLRIELRDGGDLLLQPVGGRTGQELYEHAFLVADHVWTMRFTPGPGYAVRRDWTALLLLAGGLVASAFTAVLIAGGERRRDQVERQVDARTADLRHEVAERSRLASELAERNRQLELASIQAETATRAKSEFLATMSHEIRTPLGGVIGIAGVLLDSPLRADQRAHVHTLRASARHLLLILDDILDFSKIEAGRLVLEEAAFEPRALAEEVIALLAETAHSKGLEIAAVIDPALPRRLVGDPGRLRQVLFNLVGNAVKFTTHGTVMMRLRTEPGDGEGDVILHATVTDTGIGIPADRISALFAPFVQVDAGTTRRFGGTGLGLAISKRLVALMGGGIEVESVVGQGSAFHFSVRVARCGEGAPAEPGALAGRRVLVASQRAASREALICALQAAGADAIGVAGAEAAGAAITQGVDVALIDAELPAAAAVAAHAGAARSVALVTRVKPGAPGAFTTSVGLPVRAHLLSDCLVAVLTGRDPGPGPTGAEPARDPALIGTRVLVAEDNPVNLRVAVHLLQRLGCTVETAVTGGEAVAAVARGAVDLVLMDCQMPEMDGYQAAGVIRRVPGSTHRIPIIAVTASALPGERERCLAAGMDGYLAKPLVESTLAAALHRWLAPAASDQDLPPVLDPAPLAELRRRHGQDMAIEVIAVFRETGLKTLGDLGQAGGDLAALRRLAHRLKGAALLVGLRRLAAACAAAESGRDALALARRIAEETRRGQLALDAIVHSG